MDKPNNQTPTLLRCHECGERFFTPLWRLRCPQCVQRLGKAMYDSLEDHP